MRRYTATQDELQAYIGLVQQIATAKAEHDAALAEADRTQQVLASAQEQVALWEQAHGEDIPDA